jgi:hypothetical protein
VGEEARLAGTAVQIGMIALAGLLAACSGDATVIDGSTPERFAETTEKARRDLPIKDRLTFDAALRTVGGRRYADKDPDETARDLYNGMTAADVVADAHARGIE